MELELGTGEKVLVQVKRDWAPLGVKQFLAMVESHALDNDRFFRVVPNFIVQFGINGNPAISKYWEKKVIKDDPVVASNTRGTLTFATAGPNTRTSQLFFNFKDNKGLDSQGFAPFGVVLGDGMQNIDRVNAEYREKVRRLGCLDLK